MWTSKNDEEIKEIGNCYRRDEECGPGIGGDLVLGWGAQKILNFWVTGRKNVCLRLCILD